MDPIILLLRIAFPLLILRFPLVGGLGAMWLDGIDWHINFFNTSNPHLYYQELDKILDIYYLSIEAFVAYHWRSRLASRIALSLFFYRMVGVLLYEVTNLRIILFLFPNIFESFFLFYLGCKKLLGKEPRLSWPLAITGVTILTILKLIQEYPMHVQQLWQWQYIQINLFSDKLIFQYDNIFHQIFIAVIMMLIFVFLLQKHPRLRSHYVAFKKFFYTSPPD